MLHLKSKEIVMNIEIHWPNGITVNYAGTNTSDKTWLSVMYKVIDLSTLYDVIIDNGVITFVEKS
jgi:hypothetical protein